MQQGSAEQDDVLSAERCGPHVLVRGGGDAARERAFPERLPAVPGPAVRRGGTSYAARFVAAAAALVRAFRPELRAEQVVRRQAGACLTDLQPALTGAVPAFDKRRSREGHAHLQTAAGPR